MILKFRNTLWLFLLLLITVVFVQGNNYNSSSVLPSTDDQCPPWYFYNHTKKQCECYSKLNAYTDDIVKCAEDGVLLRFGFCMTFKEKDGFYVGSCNYFDLSKYNLSDTVNYFRLPSNVSELNSYMCTPLNREGTLCGQCKDGYGHSLTSITSVRNTCEKCDNLYWLSLLGYLILELLQVVVVYFVVLFLGVKFNSVPLMAFVLHCQIQEFSYLTFSNTIPDAKIALLWKVLVVFYAIFNLNFCWYIIPAFCVSPSLKAFELAFLDYIPLIYLLLLLVLTRICIKLHSKDWRLVIWLWNKLNRLSIHINARWDTICDAFVIILVLSFANLVFNSVWTAALPIGVWNAKNFSVDYLQFYVYLDPDIDYFHGEHLPFVIVSSFITFFIVLPLPTLLALYPTKCFRALLFRCPIVNRHMSTINTFLDKFYCGYRDGLDGGRDMRSFVSLYYFVYWLFFIVNFLAALLQLVVNMFVIVFAMFGFLIAIVRPYKRTFMNVAGTLILANLALLFLLLDICGRQKTFSSSARCYITFGVLNYVVPFVFIVAISYTVLKKSSCCRPSIRDIHDEGLIEQSSFDLDIDTAHETPNHLFHSELHNQQSNNYGSNGKFLSKSYP